MLDIVGVVARACLEGILVVLTAGLGIIAAKTIPFRFRVPRDAEQRKVLWLHLAIWFFVLANFFDIMGYVAETTESAGRDAADYSVGEGSTRLYVFSSLFNTINNSFVLLSLSGVGVGIYQVATGIKRRWFDYAMAGLAATAAAVEVIAFLALQGTTLKHVDFMRHYYPDHLGQTDTFSKFNQSEAVTAPILFCGAAATLWLTCLARREAKRADLKLYQKLVRLLIVATTMNALIRAWGTCQAAFRLGSFNNDCPSGGVCWALIDVPINRYGGFVVLVLLFAVEHQKVNGLWTSWRDPFRRGNFAPGGRDIELESN